MMVGRPHKRNMVIQYVLDHPHEKNKAKIAEELHISRQTVYKYWQVARAKLPKRRRYRTKKISSCAYDYDDKFDAWLMEKEREEFNLCEKEECLNFNIYEEDDYGEGSVAYNDGSYYMNEEGDILPL